MKHALLAASILVSGLGATISAQAQTAADLGRTLTPMGAVKAGNADGSIPAWTGGYTTPAPGWKPGDPRPDPFASERPLFSITSQNVDKYQGKLADGTVAMIRTLPGYHVDVYPTHRTAAAPQYIYDNAIANASRASLTPNGDGRDRRQIVDPVPGAQERQRGDLEPHSALARHADRAHGQQRHHHARWRLQSGTLARENPARVQLAQREQHGQLGQHVLAGSVGAAAYRRPVDLGHQPSGPVQPAA